MKPINYFKKEYPDIAFVVNKNGIKVESQYVATVKQGDTSWYFEAQRIPHALEDAANALSRNFNRQDIGNKAKEEKAREDILTCRVVGIIDSAKSVDERAKKVFFEDILICRPIRKELHELLIYVPQHNGGAFQPNDLRKIVGYTSVANSSKFKELLYTISGTFVGAIFEIVILRVAMSFLRDFPTIAANGASGLSGNFFDGLGYWEGVTASIMVYAGVYFAATSGNHSIERWLGVSTGQNMGKRMLATAGGAYFGTRAALQTSKSLARGTAKGIRLGADGIHGGAQIARKGVHAAAHPIDTYSGIKDKVTDKVQGIRDKVTDLHENSMMNFIRQTGGVGADGGGISPQAPNTPTSSSPIFQEPQQPERPENNIPGNPPVDPPIQGQPTTSPAPQSATPTNSPSSPGGIREPQPSPNPTPAPSPLPNSQPDSLSAPSPQMPQPESGNRGIESTPVPTTKPTSEANPGKDKVLSNMEGLPVKGKFTIDDFKF